MAPEVWTLLGQLVILGGTLGVGLITSRGGRKTQELAAKASPYDALAARVVHLEGQVTAQDERIERLERELAASEKARGEVEQERDRLADALDQARRLIYIALRFVDKHVPAAIHRPWTRPAWLDAEDTPI